ncbi:MAG: TolB family protein [Syntrophorhabdaceae bacterium]
MDSDTKRFGLIMFIAAVVLVFALMAQSCAEEDQKRTHLEHFTNVDDFSISSDGNQLIFTGCGHQDFPECTAYRYDRKENVLYRYVHEDTSMQVMGGQYWSDSKQFLCDLVPRGENRKQLIGEMQIAIMNPDGTGLRQLTEGKGVKGAHMLSPDGKTLVYAKGTERPEGKTLASRFDFYARDIATGKETRITKLSFYELGTPYFTPDGKHIVFDHYGVMRLPDSDDWHATTQFREEYMEKYQRNFILQYPVDGSGINRKPEPWFIHGVGSDNPIITKDGSLFFQGISGGNKFYCRYPNGEIARFTSEELAIGKTRFPFRITVDPTGHWMAILYEDLGNSKRRSAGLFNTSGRSWTPISIPAIAKNIPVH